MVWTPQRTTSDFVLVHQSLLMVRSTTFASCPAVYQTPPVQVVGPHVATVGMKFYTGMHLSFLRLLCSSPSVAPPQHLHPYLFTPKLLCIYSHQMSWIMTHPVVHVGYKQLCDTCSLFTSTFV